MLKFTIKIKEANKDASNVTIEVPKDISKATKNEKQTASAVYNAICDALKNLQK